MEEQMPRLNNILARIRRARAAIEDLQHQQSIGGLPEDEGLAEVGIILDWAVTRMIDLGATSEVPAVLNSFEAET
jgi:hypothetical protein